MNTSTCRCAYCDTEVICDELQETACPTCFTEDAFGYFTYLRDRREEEKYYQMLAEEQYTYEQIHNDDYPG